jgi:hypothetical protein
MKISLKYLGFSCHFPSFLSPAPYNTIMSMFLFILVSIKNISLTCIKATGKSLEAWITAFLAKENVMIISSTMLAVIALACGL